MTFQEWVEQSGLSQTEIAEKIGVSAAMITSVMLGRKRFGPTNARKVVELSGEKLTLEEVLFPGEPKKASSG